MIAFTYNIDLFEASAKEYVQVQAVLLDNKELTLAAGTSKKIGATVVPSDATNPEITWTTTDSDVVSVDQEGNIVALKQGQAVIRATAEERYEELVPKHITTEDIIASINYLLNLQHFALSVIIQDKSRKINSYFNIFSFLALTLFVSRYLCQPDMLSSTKMQQIR